MVIRYKFTFPFALEKDWCFFPWTKFDWIWSQLYAMRIRDLYTKCRIHYYIRSVPNPINFTWYTWTHNKLCISSLYGPQLLKSIIHVNSTCKNSEWTYKTTATSVYASSGNVSNVIRGSILGQCLMSSERFANSKSWNWKAGAQVHPTRE